MYVGDFKDPTRKQQVANSKKETEVGTFQMFGFSLEIKKMINDYASFTVLRNSVGTKKKKQQL